MASVGRSHRTQDARQGDRRQGRKCIVSPAETGKFDPYAERVRGTIIASRVPTEAGPVPSVSAAARGVELSGLVLSGKRSTATVQTIRINAVWAAMSLSYYSSESLRERIVTSLGVDILLMRLEDPVGLVRQKALGIVRNLFTVVYDPDHRDGPQQVWS
ncbi:hypothetical protein RRG08_061861 [Elysia crispata]|uniref:Uncharacterized protein n=1 Tax=Elysia crispata TaxID=231223 RepID=A0AAE0XMA2_9GAST|nr:hypothetical protein RRG08_061861 [Elysia crispata]